MLMASMFDVKDYFPKYLNAYYYKVYKILHDEYISHLKHKAVNLNK